ncbi:MAG: STAS domain-containing protein [Calditrichia bacterium]
MNFSERRIGDIIILDLSGNLMGGPEAVTINDTVNRLLDNGVYKLIINMAEVERINSSGLGILIKALTTFKRNGGELKLARLNPKVENLLVMTKLDTILESFESEEAAINNF